VTTAAVVEEEESSDEELMPWEMPKHLIAKARAKVESEVRGSTERRLRAPNTAASSKSGISSKVAAAAEYEQRLKAKTGVKAAGTTRMSSMGHELVRSRLQLKAGATKKEAPLRPARTMAAEQPDDLADAWDKLGN